MDFDNAKENIQPLAAGRNASILHASLHAESSHELQVQRHELEQIIHTYQGEDPLEAWYDYISWIEQSYPSGGKESGLEEVLTKCLTAFERDKRYFQDRRLIRLYIKFIEMQNNQNATEFYQQLFNEGIGTMVADFYICWAYCYDLSGNYRKADEIFRRGIACRAEPLEELQEAHQHFGFTISQRMLYKDDENATEYSNKQLQERRLALSALRSHRKKVGSVRTGAAVKNYTPGKLETVATSTTTRQGNARVHVFSEENENSQTTSVIATAGALQPTLVVDEDPTKNKSVVRSIIDQARNQENKKEPGPWNNAHDKKKEKLYRTNATDLGFEILEDDSSTQSKKPRLVLNTNISTEEIKPFKPFPNFKIKNRPLPEWSTPVTIENTTQPRAYPQYHKSKLYPRPNLEYQLEELLAYNWFSKRGIKNSFTLERDAVWKSYEIGAVRKYPNFATKSRVQKLDAIDAYYEPEKIDGLVADFKQIYNTLEQEEMQIEEVMMKRLQAGVRRIRFDANETIIIATEMDETVCMPQDGDPVNRRKSFFPTRKSMGQRASMLPNVTQPLLTMCENVENEYNDVVSESKAEVIKQKIVPTIKVKMAEQVLNQSFEKCSLTEDNDEQPTTSAAARAKAQAFEKKQLDAAAEMLSSAPLALHPSIHQDNFEFKTPAPPAVTGVKSKLLPFEIYEESIEERNTPPSNNAYEFFEADETCSTQVFNCFIKQQSVSTPNPPQKTVSRIFGTVLKERTEPVAETTLATHNDGATDIKVVAATSAAGALNFSPPCQKQLSTILETSEQGTNTKSTISSPECDALDAKSSVTAHTHMETLKEVTCETTSMVSVLEPNTDKNAVEQPSSLVTTTLSAATTPSAARFHQGGVNFSKFEDCPENAVTLPKQVGNFSRLEDHEDTTAGYLIQSIKFQEDKTETVPKMPFTVRTDSKFPEDKTETLSILYFAPPPTVQYEEDKTETLVKPTSLDDTFKFFTQTPPKKLLSTSEFLGFDMEGITLAPKYTTKYADDPQLRETLPFFDKMNASNREKQGTSLKAAVSTTKLLMLEDNTTKKCTQSTVNCLNNSLRDSFMPDFSVIEETQPQSQQKPEELKTKTKELSFIKDSQPHYSRASSLKQNLELAQKQPTAAPIKKSLMNDSFNLPDFSMVMDSQRTYQQSGTRWQRTEPAHEHILTDSYMKDFSAIKEPTPQKITSNTSTRAKLNNESSSSFKAPENASKNYAKTFAYAGSSSTKSLQYIKPLQSVANRNSIKPDDFFELNAETAQFAPNLSIIRNSTLLPHESKQRYTQFHEKSLHIKEELPFENSCEKSFEMFKTPTDPHKPEPAQTKTSAKLLPTKYLFPNNDEVHVAEKEDEENSIYFKNTPKTPKIQRHIWNNSGEDELQENPNFIHRTPDLNHTLQIIEHIHLDDKVNPFNAELIKAFLEQIDFTNFIENLSTCQLVGRVKQLHKDTIIAVNDVKFKVQKLIGEGAYGAVYCASQMKTGKKYALKQEKPPNYWEYYICLEVHSRLAIDELIPAFMSVDYALIGNNAGILISPLSAHGSLIAVCNKIKHVTMKNCDEYVVMHIACLLLEIMDHLHAIEIIHADIKADNFLLMDKLSYNRKQPSSIQLIDFGVSIDMRLFKKGQTFSYAHKENSIKCVEMRENRRWTYQLDLFGLAGVIHVLLFGKYMNVEKNVNGFWMHTTHVPRYLHKTLWERIFKSLLNIRDCSSMPNLQNLRVLIKEELAENESCVMQKIFEFNRILDG